MSIKFFSIITLLFLSVLSSFTVIGKVPLKEQANTLNIAVSSNFSHILKKLLPQFEKNTSIKTQVFIGSTGNLFQQIYHGAPYDIFIAADKLRPQRLIEANIALENTLKTYAFGTVSFWSAHWKTSKKSPENLPTFESLIQLIKDKKVKLAIANPNIAPYGLAAKQVIESNKLWHIIEKNQLITGSNINQTFQQVRSGAVPLGIVADSQLKVNDLTGVTIPKEYYQPIEQQLVLISASKNTQQAQLLSQYLLSDDSQNIIKTLGYESASKYIHNGTLINGSSRND
ncbi:MAG: molybdate ABC transporter substrate-binding protein [Thalassotalea sp.]|nr:molybdate ABC transporter substrate-binding protein [Thalassotalea sp.]